MIFLTLNIRYKNHKPRILYVYTIKISARFTFEQIEQNILLKMKFRQNKKHVTKLPEDNQRGASCEKNLFCDQKLKNKTDLKQEK